MVIEMLKRFEVTNYKNFKDKIVIDMGKVGGYHFNQECITDGKIGKMLIYGRNATGKTNLGKALMDISYIGWSGVRLQAGPLLNADSSQRDSLFKYVFQFGEDEIIYTYRRLSENVLLDEEMVVNGRQAFYYNFETRESSFGNLKILDADTVVIERFIAAMDNAIMESDEKQTLPFLRWLINNTPLQDGSLLLRLNDYMQRMSMLTVSESGIMRSRRVNESFYELLAEGENLKDFEEFLNIMGVECRLDLKKLPDGQLELYFVHVKPVPFMQTASSGTQALLRLYMRLIMRREASLLYIDEFDAFYHYEMSEKVVQFFKKKYPNSQIIMTTHNTNLMSNSLMRPDCLFILSGQGYLTALCDATPRELREGHNLEKLYISGEFEDYE